MILTYPLPSDTRKHWHSCQFRCHNLSLLLDRYIGYPQQWGFKEEHKLQLLQKLKDHFDNKNISSLIAAKYSRWQKMIEFSPYAQSFTASPEWRMVVGLGQTTILETGMTLERGTGIPFIPGSSIKGLAAAYALLNELEETERKNIESVANPSNLQKDFLDIFGTQKTTGKVIFFDAVPTKSPQLELDIMNNHYPDYYDKKSPPTPSQNPNPVYFLTLGSKSEFAFAVAARDNKPETEQLVIQAKEWLYNGLSEMGIGAKTAAGYGYLLS